MINLNDLQSAICDMVDIEKSVPQRIQNYAKDSEGTDITIGDCISDVLYFLRNLENKILEENKND
jgi:hypothetical protein|tara:strand:- start:162 stop:356 length:195 start_codon:yes stop_codon:yes gene_type:complete